MKVLMVLDCFYPNIDGPINCIEHLAKSAKKFGVAVELLVPNYPKNVDIDGITIHRCKSMKAPEGYRNALPFLDKSVKKLFKYGGFDFVHVHSPFMLGRYAIKLAKKYNIPNLATIHTKYKSDFERTLKCKFLINFMVNFILKPFNKCDKVSAVSNGAMQTLIDYGCTNPNMCVVRNGTDMKPIEIDKDLQKEIRKTYNLNKEFVFLFVGRIVENKNIQFSLSVLNKLKEKTSNFKFLIVGDGPYITELKELVSQYNLSQEVIFTGKIMDRNFLAGIYSCADLFLFPSSFDTFGLVAMEAGTNGIPSVMVENTCASEMIETGKNGLALPEDIDAWVDSIFSLINHSKTLSAMKKQARETLNVSWDKIMSQYLEIYEDLINKAEK